MKRRPFLGPVGLILAMLVVVSTARGEMWMSLEDYVAKCVLIVRAKTVLERDGKLTFRVIETWKGRYTPDVFVETTIDGRFFAYQGEHGVKVVDGQEIAFFFTKHNQPNTGKLHRHSTAFPISNGELVYGSTSMNPQKYTVDAFHKRIVALSRKTTESKINGDRVSDDLQCRITSSVKKVRLGEPLPLKLVLENGYDYPVHFIDFGEIRNVEMTPCLEFTDDKIRKWRTNLPKITGTPSPIPARKGVRGGFRIVQLMPGKKYEVSFPNIITPEVQKKLEKHNLPASFTISYVFGKQVWRDSKTYPFDSKELFLAIPELPASSIEVEILP